MVTRLVNTLLLSGCSREHFNSDLPNHGTQLHCRWEISKVTNYLESLGDNVYLSMQVLIFKTAMLMALTRPSWVIDLTSLNLNFRRYSLEGVTFLQKKLAKQSRQKKPLSQFFFPHFTKNDKLCPVITLQAYKEQTKEQRSRPNKSQLFIGLVKPYNQVASSTIARLQKSVL